MLIMAGLLGWIGWLYRDTIKKKIPWIKDAGE